MRFESIAVIGAGAWGTALAQAAALAGRRVRLWGRDASVLQDIKARRENTRYLPGTHLHSGIEVESELSSSLRCQLALLVIPAQALRQVCLSLCADIGTDVPIVICAKGIEQGTQKFMTEVAADILPDNPVAILSGPSFAGDVVQGLPTAVTVAAQDNQLAIDIGEALATQTFRLYHSQDVRGVEIGGAAKNVLAIACGIAEGSRLGASAKAALIARGFAELRRFAAAFGAQDETLMGLSGLGDLVLTCSSAQSRNFRFGIALGQGTHPDSSAGKLVEGVFTAYVLDSMARDAGIEMPIVAAVNAVLQGKLDVGAAISGLMMRPQKSETGA